MQSKTRRILIGIGATLAAGAAVVALLPYFIGASIILVCDQPYSQICQNRMRALGHSFAARGQIETAASWYERAAGAGDRVAMFHLGWAHTELMLADLKASAVKAVEEQTAFFVPARFGPHAEIAAEWYRASADLGFAPAMNNLGELYRTGTGVERVDCVEAFNWHLASAKAGNPVGAMNASIDYRTGTGTPKSPTSAKDWETISLEATSDDDLNEPTFARTLYAGLTIPSDHRELIRQSKKDHLPFKMTPATGNADITLRGTCRSG